MRYGYFIVEVDYRYPLFTAIMSRMIGRQYSNHLQGRQSTTNG